MNKKFRNILALVLISVLGTSAFVGVAAMPASAAWSNCADNTVCVFDGFNGGGSPILTFTDAAWGGSGICFNFPSSANDKMSSAFNRFHSVGTHTRKVIFYRDSGCSTGGQTGFSGGFQLPAQTSFSYDTGSGFCLPPCLGNDTVTSIYFVI